MIRDVIFSRLKVS